MFSKQRCLLVLLAALSSLGASYRTANFTVEAADEEIAREVGDKAEIYRKQIALQWLGEEMPTWGRPCPIRVTVTMNGPGGATEFDFYEDAILSIRMHIEGSRDHLLFGVLPHEVTHTVLAYHFRRPVPRWADEGGSVLSEDELYRFGHDQHAWTILQTPGRAIPIRRLLGLMRYPRDVMILYAQGYSLSRFLIESRNRKTFLAFIGDGMDDEWDTACQKHYRYPTVEAMEEAWVKWVRVQKRKHQREAPRRRLEKEFEILALENQLLQVQVRRENPNAEGQTEQDRLKAKIRRARRTLRQFPEEVQPVSLPANAPRSPVPVQLPPVHPPVRSAPIFVREVP